MEESILDFAKQFGYSPELQGELPSGYKHIILAGMGGSHLAADLLKTAAPGTDIYVHKNYDLPPYDEGFFGESLLVASSYSGNTEETVSFLESGVEAGHNIMVISTGGKLLELAIEHDLPYIQIPDTGIQPRLAVGFSAIALASVLPEQSDAQRERKQELRAALASMETILTPEQDQILARELASKLTGKTPVIYTSSRNLAVAYNWKIKFNETAKIPAFYNIFPEMNHNEMQGFGLSEETQEFANRFHIFFLTDDNDHERIQKRMKITQELYDQKGITTTELKIEGKGRLHALLKTILIADWVALTIAQSNNSEPEQVPMIEEFKKRLVT